MFLVVGGALFEREETGRAWHRFPPSDTPEDVGNRSLQLDYRGQGIPVVVFEAGLDINLPILGQARHR